MTSNTDGGRVAARGLQYQYIATLESLLDHTDDPGVAAVRVEGSSRVSGIDCVDFDLLDADGRCVLAAQIKTQATGNVGAGTAFDVLFDVASRATAQTYLVRYGATPGASSRELARALSDCQHDAGRLKLRLRQIFEGSAKRQRQVRSLTGDELDRLSRSTLAFDLRTEAEIRTELRERLRAWRNGAEAGLGEQSAGLLAGFLISEIMRRAADETAAELAMEDWRSCLLIDGQTLARAFAARDWGVLVGPMTQVPDVCRPGPLGQIVDALPAAAPRGIRRVVLCGLSGIGKSSLASAFIADRGDTYDYVFWINAESASAAKRCFELVAAEIRRPLANTSEMSADAVRTIVHTELTRLPGRWVMVFDDAIDMAQLKPWLPTAGNGDILITTIDSTARYGSALRIEVPALESGECVDLLGSRLELSLEAKVHHQASLMSLADELGRWPLALELAAGYMTTCGLPIEGAPRYIELLKARALEDENSVPLGYPRTLAAALALCTAALVAKAEETGDERPVLALSMLGFSAYVAQRQIPAQVLAAAVLIDAEQTSARNRAENIDHLGPLVLNPDDVVVPELVRELRRYSLVSVDEPLPPPAPELTVQDEDQTVAVNSIVQVLLRSDLDRQGATSASLSNLAFHLERWLTAGIRLGDLHRAAVIFPHADLLASHALRLNIRSQHFALLFGNLATAHSLLGNTERAEQLLRAEIDLLEEMPNHYPVLPVQARIALLRSYCKAPNRSSVSPDEARRLLEHALAEASTRAFDDSGVAMTICATVLHLLGENRWSVGSPPFIPSKAALVAAFEDLRSRLEETSVSTAYGALERAAELYGACDFAGAERACRDVLAVGGLDGPLQVEASRVLIDSIACQLRWSDASEAFAQYQHQFGSMLLPMTSQAMLVHNVGLYCAAHWMDNSGPSSCALLSDLLTWIPISRFAGHIETWRFNRIQLIEAVCQATRGNSKAVLPMVSTLLPKGLVGDTPSEDVTWIQLLAAAQQRISLLALATPATFEAASSAEPDADVAAWNAPAYRQYRRADVRFLGLPRIAPADAVLELTLPFLALYLEYGVQEEPSRDLATTLCAAFAELGVAAELRTARLDIRSDTGDESRHLRWTVVVPASGRMIDMTAEAIPIVREQAAGPVIAKVADPNIVSADQLFAVGAQWAPLRRGSIRMRYTLVGDERSGSDETLSAESSERYREAGLALSSTFASLLLAIRQRS